MTEHDSLERLAPGWAAYRAGDFFGAHEYWEAVWAEPSIPQRPMIQSLIQVAVSLVHLENGNLRGARSLAAKALQKLRRTPHPAWIPADWQTQVEDYARHLDQIQVVTEFRGGRIPRLPCFPGT